MTFILLIIKTDIKALEITPENWSQHLWVGALPRRLAGGGGGPQSGRDQVQGPLQGKAEPSPKSTAPPGAGRDGGTLASGRCLGARGTQVGEKAEMHQESARP